MLSEYYNDDLSPKEAKERAQRLTFYPMMFQAARVLRETGIFDEICDNRRNGITPTEIADKLKLPYYGVNTLLEVALSEGMAYLKGEDLYAISKMGYFLLKDNATVANLNFTHDVCYKSMFHLEEAIREETPAGLKEIGLAHHPTVYPGLSELVDPIKKSWFDFDHYYSDGAFPEALKIVFKENHKAIADIGGNTGKWSIACCNHNDEVKMTIVDLPGQWNMAKANIESLNLSDRVFGLERDMLKDDLNFPDHMDGVWMSQFLDCFSEEQILQILTNVSNAIDENAFVYILELFWDRQVDLAAANCLHGTSLYFTAVANGNSKMYHSKDLYKAIDKAGLEVVYDEDQVGEFHTLLKCKKK